MNRLVRSQKPELTGQPGGGWRLTGIDPDEPLRPALERQLRTLTGVVVSRDQWQLDQVPEHLKLTFRIVDENDRELAQGKDLAALKAQLRGQLRQTLAAAASNLARTGLTTWGIGDLPRTVQRQRSGIVVTAYPALVDKGDTVAVEILDTPGRQRQAMWRGTRRLLLLNAPSPVKTLQRGLNNAEKLAVAEMGMAVACAVTRRGEGPGVRMAPVRACCV